MRGLFDFLLQNPILIFILLAWVAGMVGNVMKAARKTRERSEHQRRMPAARPSQAPPPVRAAGRPAAPGQPGQPSSDDIAAEMRRILGMEPTASPTRPAARPTQPAPRRRLVEAERPPTPALPTAQQRKLELHIDPHVGERIGKGEKKRPRIEASVMGTLGGRVQRQVRVREAADRFPRSNLRQAVVLSEILGPPLALRRPDPERLQ
jgi:hypothetical protein